MRELEEETGLRVAESALILHDISFVPHPDDTTVVVIVYRLNRRETSGSVRPGGDAGDAEFWQLNQFMTEESMKNV